MDGEILRKSLFRTKHMRLTLGTIIVLSIVAGLFKMRADYLELLEVREAYIHQEIIETTIHEEPDK